MRCLYEVLGLSEDADDLTIRKAYRKAALAWHPGQRSCLAVSSDHDVHYAHCHPQRSFRCPDKNQSTLELADARFKEIQNAWEVLSDPREKAW